MEDRVTVKIYKGVKIRKMAQYLMHKDAGKKSKIKE